MGIIIRQSLWNAGLTWAGILLGFITTILLYPNILDPEQYGLTRILISAGLIGAQFSHLGIRNLIIRYLPFFRNADRDNPGLLFWSLLIPFLGFILFSAFYYLFRDVITGYYAAQSPLILDFYLWVLPITFFILYFEVLNSYLRSLHDSTTGSFTNEVLLRVVSILILIIYFFELIDFNQFILLFTAGYALQPVVLMWKIGRMGELKLSPNISLMRNSLVRSMTGYSIYTLFGGLTTLVVWNVDVIMLASMEGLAQTAVYSIAFYVGSVIAVPQRAIEKIASPLVSEFMSSGNLDDVANLYRKTSINQLIAGVLFFVLIVANLEILFMMLPEIYQGGFWVVVIIGIGKLIDMVTGINGSIIIYSKHYRFDFVTNILLVIFTISTNLWLIPLYGVTGAAAATALSLLFYNLIKFIFVYRKLGMQPFSSGTLWVMLAGAVSLFTALYIWETGFFIADAVIRSVLILILFMIPVYKLNISPDANQLIAKLFNRKGENHHE